MAADPLNWYWNVAGDLTHAFSSAAMAYVPAADADFVTWLAAGNVATQIYSAGDLAAVLLTYWLPRKLAQGIALTSTGTPALSADYASDPAALANIVAVSTGIAAGKPLPGGDVTFSYLDATGTGHAFSGPDFLNFAAAVEGYNYNLVQAAGTIAAGGTIALPSRALTIA